MPKPTPKELQKYLQTHTPNRAERRKFEAMERKQKRDIVKGRRKVKPVSIKKIPWWIKLIRFVMRKK